MAFSRNSVVSCRILFFYPKLKVQRKKPGHVIILAAMVPRTEEIEEPTVVRTVQRVSPVLWSDPRATWKTKGNKAWTKVYVQSRSGSRCVRDRRLSILNVVCMGTTYGQAWIVKRVRGSRFSIACLRASVHGWTRWAG